MVGRESGNLRLTVTERSDRETLERVVRRATWPMAMVNTDEWGGYNGLPEAGRSRATVCHAEHEWARDDRASAHFYNDLVNLAALRPLR